MHLAYVVAYVSMKFTQLYCRTTADVRSQSNRLLKPSIIIIIDITTRILRYVISLIGTLYSILKTDREYSCEFVERCPIVVQGKPFPKKRRRVVQVQVHTWTQ